MGVWIGLRKREIERARERERERESESEGERERGREKFRVESFNVQRADFEFCDFGVEVLACGQGRQIEFRIQDFVPSLPLLVLLQPLLLLLLLLLLRLLVPLPLLLILLLLMLPMTTLPIIDAALTIVMSGFVSLRVTAVSYKTQVCLIYAYFVPRWLCACARMAPPLWRVRRLWIHRRVVKEWIWSFRVSDRDGHPPRDMV